MLSHRLSVVQKKIELLFPIEFKGAKASSKDLNAAGGAYALPEFADEATVRQICSESAQALVCCNKLLVAKGFRPFGLEVGGHTSMNSETSQRTSLERAKAVATLVAEELGIILKDGSCKKLIAAVSSTGSGALPWAGGHLVSVGYGATRKLPGYDDEGGNHKENRRVEIRVLVGEEEAEPEDEVVPRSAGMKRLGAFAAPASKLRAWSAAQR